MVWHRVYSGKDLPLCLTGDRLEFMVESWPTICDNGRLVERHERAGATYDGASIVGRHTGTTENAKTRYVQKIA